jgi:hypothetical protein
MIAIGTERPASVRTAGHRPQGGISLGVITAPSELPRELDRTMPVDRLEFAHGAQAVADRPRTDGNAMMSGTFRRFRLTIFLLLLASAAGQPASAQVEAPTRVPASRWTRPARPVGGQRSGPGPTSQVRQANHLTPIPEPLYEEAGLACDAYPPSDITLDGAACGTATCLPLWGSFEYLLWWEREADYPALATTSPNGTARENAGVLGLNSTSVLFGGDSPVDSGSLSGGRLTLGFWLDTCQINSIAGRGFGIEEHGVTFSAASDDNSILGRPFFNAFTGEQDALLLAFPGELRGDIEISQDTQAQGAQAFVRHLCRTGSNYRIDTIYGYRYLGVDDSLRIDNTLEFTDPAGGNFGTRLNQFDLFEIENEFHGGELGLMGHSVDGRWTLDFLATVALGSMQQRANVRGRTITTPQGGGPTTLNGGLLTQGTNIGTFEDDPFAVVPEVTVTLGYCISPRLDFSVGYTFLYASNVMRAGDVMDTAVNLTQQTSILDGPARPAFQFQDSGYWLQGINFGLNLRY